MGPDLTPEGGSFHLPPSRRLRAPPAKRSSGGEKNRKNVRAWAAGPPYWLGLYPGRKGKPQTGTIAPPLNRPTTFKASGDRGGKAGLGADLFAAGNRENDFPARKPKNRDMPGPCVE